MCKHKQIGLIFCGAIAGFLCVLITVHAQPESGTSSYFEGFQKILTAIEVIQQNYFEPVKTEKLATAAVIGMLNGLDPYSTYLDEKAYKALQVNPLNTSAVSSKVIARDYVFIRVDQFQKKTFSDMVAHLLKLGDQPRIKGIVFDLRNNPGGLLHEAIRVASLFLPPKVLIVSTESRNEDFRHHYIATQENYFQNDEDNLRQNFTHTLPAWTKTIPLVVLVNSETISAAEIVAGALQDHHRATILGTPTFGKGSIQQVFPLDRTTAIKLTTAYYFTPSGQPVQDKGIKPDLFVKNVAQNNLAANPTKDYQLEQAIRYLKMKKRQTNPRRELDRKKYH